MAPLVTHLVVGERFCPKMEAFVPTILDYGTFLLGCLLADVNAFSDIDRSQTHFAERRDVNGKGSFRRSCASFVEQMDSVLLCPWREPEGAGRAFVTGYLVDAKLADPKRLVIMDGSAAGYTVLKILVDHPGTLKAGICPYGMASRTYWSWRPTDASSRNSTWTRC